MRYPSEVANWIHEYIIQAAIQVGEINLEFTGS